MIAALMAFLLAVSAVAGAAALVGEAGLRRLGAASRWTWLGALSLGPLLLLAGAVGDGGTGAAAGPGGALAVVELPPLVVGPSGAGTWALLLDGAATAIWLASSLALLLVLLRTHRRIEAERAGWDRTRVLEHDVFVSEDRGPAVAGLLRPWIVLPRWVLAMPERELRLVLVHEEEHVRARDTALLGAALALVLLTAWNPLAWWQLRRLRVAMEVDCDRRVLGRLPGPAAYAESLFSVAARSAGPALGLAAFTERSLSLDRRIIAMTTRRTRAARIGGGLLVAAALVPLAQACGVDNPVAAGSASDADPVRAEIPAQPTFTPFTVAPSIVNRHEVMRTMLEAYPPLLRDAGIGGTVIVWFYVDEQGRVLQTRIHESSGHEAIDRAALRTAEVYRFSPALNGDEAVPVWVMFPITFTTR